MISVGFRRPITILRRGMGAIGDDGYYIPGTEQEMTIFASIQPLNTNEYTQITADGARNVRYVKVYTNTPLHPAKEAGWGKMEDSGPWEADIILWHGSRFQVIKCDPYQSGVISHYKAIAQEVMPDDE